MSSSGAFSEVVSAEPTNTLEERGISGVSRFCLAYNIDKYNQMLLAVGAVGALSRHSRTAPTNEL
jgi:hypothetical protein